MRIDIFCLNWPNLAVTVSSLQKEGGLLGLGQSGKLVTMDVNMIFNGIVMPLIAVWILPKGFDSDSWRTRLLVIASVIAAILTHEFFFSELDWRNTGALKVVIALTMGFAYFKLFYKSDKSQSSRGDAPQP